MRSIDTKQIRNKWYCFDTINGYDHSFEDNTIEGAQEKMKELLKSKGITDAVFTEPRPYVFEKKLPVPQIRYASNRLDYLK